MADFISGDDLILSIALGSPLEWKPVACLTSNGISESTDFAETVTKCDPGVTVVTPTNYSYSISFEGLLTDTTSMGGDTAKASWDAIKGIQRAKDKVEWKMATVDSDLVEQYGEGYFDALEITGAAGENIAFTGSIKGTGSITAVDPL
jgi:hypothetical protein